MFDLNYLGHKLELINFSDYHCVICKIRVWYFTSNRINEMNKDNYMMNINLGYENVLSCHEMIIKNIIE